MACSLKNGEKKTDFIGSPCWMAPEVVEQQTGYDTKADVWSLGITALEIVEGKPPHYNLPAVKALVMVLNCPAPSLNKYESWSDEFRSFVQDCLHKDPKQRISSRDIIEKHAKFFDKSQGRSYIKSQLLHSLPPLTDRISKKVTAAGQAYFDQKYKK